VLKQICNYGRYSKEVKLYRITRLTFEPLTIIIAGSSKKRWIGYPQLSKGSKGHSGSN
jgi:hypothetical protein